MTVTIRDKTYTADLSFARLIRFVGRHRCSAFDLLGKTGDSEAALLLIRLLYDSIEPEGMTFEQFIAWLGADGEAFHEAYLSALKLAHEMVRVEIHENARKPKPSAEEDASGIELSILALAISSGVDTRLMELLPFSGVFDVIMKINRVKSGKQEKRFHKLAGNEISKMYAGQL